MPSFQHFSRNINQNKGSFVIITVLFTKSEVSVFKHELIPEVPLAVYSSVKTFHLRRVWYLYSNMIQSWGPLVVHASVKTFFFTQSEVSVFKHGPILMYSCHVSICKTIYFNAIYIETWPNSTILLLLMHLWNHFFSRPVRYLYFNMAKAWGPQFMYASETIC